jgi:hypothetical protein
MLKKKSEIKIIVPNSENISPIKRSTIKIQPVDKISKLELVDDKNIVQQLHLKNEILIKN